MKSMSATCPDRSGGFALVTAIFLLVVLAALGAAIVSVATMQHAGSALDVNGARAYQAARAGIEWGAYQALQNSAGAYATACRSASTAATMAFGGNLSAFSSTVTCTASSHAEAGKAVVVYKLSANACNIPAAGACPNATPGSSGYVERQLEAAVAK